jgi:hypothetical protein
MEVMMKHSNLRAVVLAICVFSISLAASTQNQSSSIGGVWEGDWISPSGYWYHAEVHLQATSDRLVKGQIDWTLKKSPRPEEQSKLGLTGVEFVKGSYDPASRVLVLDGYDKTDPNVILGLDKYRLLLAENNTVLGGITWDNGSWRGLFGLSRKPN